MLPTVEYRLWKAPQPSGTPSIVLLHEGLGCLALWRDFPQQLGEALSCDVHAYSRAGYGQSAFGPTDYAPDFMHKEAETLLAMPWWKDLCAREKPILLGHSDGASIALLASSMSPQLVSGVVALAPHLFVEAMTLQGIAKAQSAATQGDLLRKLARHHANAPQMFWRWSNIWLESRFAQWNIEGDIIQGQYAGTACPILAIQGTEDEYGSSLQLERLAQLRPQTTTLFLTQCKHSPQFDQPAACLEAISQFVGRSVRPGARSA